MLKHKILGQVYTPKWIVEEILDSVGYKGKDILNKYILEPSCGNGAFLYEIISRYLDVCTKENISEVEIINNLEKYIYAVEIDTEEYYKSINTIDELVFIKTNINKKINWKIFNQNTLEFYKNYINFFDFIVGNPPYIRIHNLDINTRNIIKNNFIFSQGTIDIYISFFEMGLKMLKKKSFLGFITPNSYLHNSSYKRFREYLKIENIVIELIDFKANKIFNGFSTYTAITILKKSNQNDFFIYKELKNNKIEIINRINFENLKNNDWSFTDPENEFFIKNINENKNNIIKDFFDVQYGFATLCDKIFISKINKINNDLVLFNDFWIEKNILKTIIKGSRFKGEIDYSNKIIFPYELINNKYVIIREDKLKNQFPKTYEYLNNHREILIKRDLDKGSLWYEFGRSQGIQTIHKEKIILSTLINKEIEFYKVSEDILMYSGIFITKNKNYSDWEIIENTLKSEEFYKYIRLTGKDFSGGYKSITSKQIKEFKINYKNPNTLF